MARTGWNSSQQSYGMHLSRQWLWSAKSSKHPGPFLKGVELKSGFKRRSSGIDHLLFEECIDNAHNAIPRLGAKLQQRPDIQSIEPCNPDRA